MKRCQSGLRWWWFWIKTRLSYRINTGQCYSISRSLTQSVYVCYLVSFEKHRPIERRAFHSVVPYHHLLHSDATQLLSRKVLQPRGVVMASLRLTTRSHLPQTIRSGVFRQTHRNASTSVVRPANPLRTGLYTTLFVVSTGLFAAYYFDSRSAVHRYVFTPLLRHLVDAETGHKIAVKVLRSGLAPKDTQVDDEVLKFEVRFYSQRVVDTCTDRRYSSGVSLSQTRSALLRVLTNMEKRLMVSSLIRSFY